MAHKERIQQVRAALSCDALLIENPTDLFYLTGCDLSLGMLLITARAARLIVDNRYYESCKQHAPVPVRLLSNESLEKELDALHVKTLGFDSAYTSYERFTKLRKLPVKLKPLSSPIAPLRMIKDPSEIALLKEAAALGSAGFDYLLKLLKPGVTEIELAVELEIFWKRQGSKALAFEPIIAFGSNSSMPHYRPQTISLKTGMPVLLDIGVNVKHYHSDMTRTVFLGRPSKTMAEIYTIVRDAQQAALDLCKPGTRLVDLDNAARSLIAKAGYGKEFCHSLGHGVGLDIHEAPGIRSATPPKETLQPGMVITIEPGIYLPGIGGVRIEDTVAITAGGHQNLTDRPTELLII